MWARRVTTSFRYQRDLTFCELEKEIASSIAPGMEFHRECLEIDYELLKFSRKILSLSYLRKEERIVYTCTQSMSTAINKRFFKFLGIYFLTKFDF